MKKIRVEDAVGLTLCHDITKVIPGEFKGRVFARGHVIRSEDVEELKRIGKEHIFVWEENAGEIHEDEAAVRIAEAVKSVNITYTQPQEGKTTLQSSIRGLFKVNSSLLKEINSIENVTVTCRPNNYPVQPGDKLAAGRIIPLVIQEEKIKYLEELCQSRGPVFEVLPFKKLKVGIIITGSEVFKGRIEDKFGPVIQRKLNLYENEILGQVYCPDVRAFLDEAIADYLSREADLIILTGGMSVDPDDLTPGAIKNSGAEVITYGAPIQPGNMFMLAYKGKTTLVGVPGAAIYFQTTALDVYLPRIFAGDRLIKEDFIRVGEGGLCLGCDVCTYPRCYYGRG
ncbi:MAG TPA: molybdopterin-binding protein [Peptococcaceae bacterium]|nr:molybdopterin-binding protein [Peptococcaceae bacterium]